MKTESHSPFERPDCSAPTPRMMAKNGAFSLVEVAMALGIFSFAIIPLVGLMGTGMNASQESIRSTTQSRIVSALAPLARASETGSRFFTVAGAETLEANPEAVYEASWSDVTSAMQSKSHNAAAGLSTARTREITISRADGGSVLARTFVLLNQPL